MSVLDGLMLAGARCLDADADHVSLVVRPKAWSVLSNVADRAHLSVEAQLCRARTRIRARVRVDPGSLARWTAGVPTDVSVDAVTLALWYALRGSVTQSGYAVRLSLRGLLHTERAREALEAQGFASELYLDRGANLQITRPGDRVALKRLIAPYIALPVNDDLGRTARTTLPDEAVEAIRARVAAGEPYADIAQDYGVNRRTVGKIARGETHTETSVSIIRRRASVKRLSRADEAQARAWAQDGLSQHAIAHLLGTNQPRICRLLRRTSPVAA